jgi:hypothetical protein
VPKKNVSFVNNMNHEVWVWASDDKAEVSDYRIIKKNGTKIGTAKKGKNKKQVKLNGEWFNWGMNSSLGTDAVKVSSMKSVKVLS